MPCEGAKDKPLPNAEQCIGSNESVSGDVVPTVIPEKPYAPQLGTLVPELSNETQQVYLIAKGHFEKVRIYRVEPTGNGEKPYIAKEYDIPPKFMMESGGYKALERLIEADHGIDTFKIQKIVDRPWESEKFFLTLEDVRGRSLDKVLEDKAVPEQLKEKLREAYVKKLKGLHQIITLPKNHPDAIASKVEQDGLPAYIYDQWTGIFGQHISIRPSQIVVTFDPLNPYRFEMTIVDPA